LLRNVEKILLKNVAALEEELLTCALCVASGKFSYLGDLPFMLYVNLGYSPLG
jgi:hypothetical protein